MYTISNMFTWIRPLLDYSYRYSVYVGHIFFVDDTLVDALVIPSTLIYGKHNLSKVWDLPLPGNRSIYNKQEYSSPNVSGPKMISFSTHHLVKGLTPTCSAASHTIFFKHPNTQVLILVSANEYITARLPHISHHRTKESCIQSEVGIGGNPQLLWYQMLLTSLVVPIHRVWGIEEGRDKLRMINKV